MIGMQRFAIFTGISKDMGVIVCHPELLGSSVCLDIYNHMERYGSHFMSSGIIGIQRLSRYLSAYVRIWESFYVIRNYWNAAFVSIFTSICNDMGVILCHPELLECSVCLEIYKHM